jgi:HlyD family secretion protein
MDRTLKPRWWRRPPVVIAGSILAAIALGGAVAGAIGLTRDASLSVKASQVTVRTVSYGAFHDFAPLRATVTPKEVVVLDAAEGGRVEAVLVANGDRIEKGQPIIRLRNSELEQQTLSQQISLMASIAQLQAYAKQLDDTRVANQRATAESAYRLAGLRRDYDSAEALFSRGYGAAAPRDRAKAALDHALALDRLQAEINRNEDALRAREMPRIAAERDALNDGLALVRAKLAGLDVVAPVAGVLSEMDLSLGQMVSQGARLGRITSPAGYKLISTVDQYYLGQVKVGQGASLQRESQTIAARVTRVDSQLKDGAFTVELAFVDPPAGLLAGQVLEGRLTLGGDRQALILAIGPFLDDTGGNWVMRFLQGSDTARRQPVVVGRRNAEQVEIVSGLSPGDRVITSSYAAYDRIQRVTVVH